MRPTLIPFLLAALACGRPSAAPVAEPASGPSRYLYVWLGDKDEKQSDFLAVVDVAPGSRSYGEVLTTVPVGMSGTLPHHMEYELPGSGRLLFANGHHHERLFLFDTRDAARPRLVRTLPPAEPYRYPHDIVRLPNGNVLVGHLRGPGTSPAAGDSTEPGGHGGIAELDPEGGVVRVAGAADSSVAAPIRPYSFAVLPAIDRLLVTSAPMMEDTTADVVQIRRLSDLALLKTMQMPPARLPNGSASPFGHMLPFEPRVMPDGSVLLNTYGCGFYRVTGIDGAEPRIENVFTLDAPPKRMGSCGIPVVAGRWWIMAVGEMRMLLVLDVSDPARPREVHRLESDSAFRPHWLARDPGSDRLVVGAEESGVERMLLARIDTTTGRLRWDESLRGADGRLGVSFVRETWPHGATGEAFGHAALFRR